MKDYWTLYEESIRGNFSAFVLLNQAALPVLARFSLLLSFEDAEKAEKIFSHLLKSGFQHLRQYQNDIPFLYFLFNSSFDFLFSFKQEECRTPDEFRSFLKEFSDRYTDLYTIDAFLRTVSSKESCPSRFDSLWQKIFSIPEEQVSALVARITKNTAYQPSTKLSMWWIFSCVLLVVGAGLFFLLSDHQTENTKRPVSFRPKIEMPVATIFSDYLERLTAEHAFDDDDEMETMNEGETITPQPSKNLSENTVNIEQIQTIKKQDSLVFPEKEILEPVPTESKDPETQVESQGEKKGELIENKQEQVNAVENVTDTRDTSESEGASDVKEAKDIADTKDMTTKEVPDQERVVQDSESKTEIEEVSEEEDDDEKETEILVIEGAKPPISTENMQQTPADVIVLNSSSEKRDLKEFQDKKVVFYAFLEVKDVEQAKEKAFAILKKFGYQGEVLRRERDYMILTATFPGKENHDKMIKKFNALGTLYVGNDVAEFLELYKKDLDKERNMFFPKYKAEDLPKEVTVNLYVMPKQK